MAPPSSAAVPPLRRLLFRGLWRGGHPGRRFQRPRVRPRVSGAGSEIAAEAQFLAIRKAGKLFGLMRQQEESRLVEVEAEKVLFVINQYLRDIERKQKESEKFRESLQQQGQTEAQRLRYEDELARKRMQTEHEAQRRQDAELVKMQQASALGKEEARRGFRMLLTDRSKLLMGIGGVTALAAGVYTTRRRCCTLRIRGCYQNPSNFDWAKKSRKGMLLFIDEADAFLCERNSTHMSEERSALNALLFRTGDQSRVIVLVLATNQPSDLDAAITDRIDEVIEFPLPGDEERFQLLRLYLNQYMFKEDGKDSFWGSLLNKQRQKIQIKDITDDLLREAARKINGFSGREIAKLVASVQAAVYGRPDCVLDPQLFMEVVEYKVAEHQQRIKLASEAAT
ncbi:hypothetical protein ABZP36_023482 [Zizania latifolia]